MRPELFMRKERGALDLFAAFVNVGSMEATERNFAVLRKELSRAEKRLMKEVRMKRMSGVSVGVHPYFGKRGSYDGEKMVVALRISFTHEGQASYDAVARFAQRLGFKEKAMALRATRNKVARELLSLARELATLDLGRPRCSSRRILGP